MERWSNNMSDCTFQLLGLLKEEKTASEIASELNISHKQLYNFLLVLKNKGFQIDRKYLYTGDIIYSLRQNISESSINTAIYTDKNDKKFEAILISDLHFGKPGKTLEYTNMVFDFAKKNGINIILCGGDFFEGYISASNLPDRTLFNIDYAFKNYPHDDKILTFIVMGNHDLTAILENGQDLSKTLANYRHDIISTGYGVGPINIKNDVLYLKHEIPIKPIVQINHPALVLKGHSHQGGIYCTDGSTFISIPTLSDINIFNSPPGFMKMSIDFVNGFFKNGIFEQYIIYDNKILPVSTNKILLLKGKNTDQKQVDFELEGKAKKL